MKENLVPDNNKGDEAVETYGETVGDFVRGLKVLDLLVPEEPFFLTFPPTDVEKKRKEFIDNMNA